MSHEITSIEGLEAIYGTPNLASTAKVTDRVTPLYRRFIEASPLVLLATSGPEGLDCSPRGDKAAAIRIIDEKTLALPDRRGNNRIDSLRNVVRDPRIGLLFLLPGSGTTIRLNGRGVVSVDPDLLASFAVDEKPPRTVLLITVDELFFQCARAIVRSRSLGVRPSGNLPPPDRGSSGAPYESGAGVCLARMTIQSNSDKGLAVLILTPVESGGTSALP